MLNNLLHKFEILNPREKWLMILAILVVLWAGWDSFFYSPLQKQQTQLQEQLTNSETELTAQQQLATQLEAQLLNNPYQTQQKQRNLLKAQYQQLQSKMLQLNQKFVPPELMSRVLNDLLKQNKQLNLIKLDTLPVATLLETPQHPIYKHGLVLQFSGNYLATLKYLKTLEAMPWNFIWDSIEYQVKNYPQAEITLRVYTLSLEKDWLDV